MSAWKEYKKKIGETRPWHAASATHQVEDLEIAQKRMAICETCPRLIKVTKQCKECGCFMNLKTKLKDAKCPIEKW